MDFNEKSFEDLLREKVEHHEFPFEAGGWAQMQSKLQAHHAQTAIQQTSLFKSGLIKAGKIFVAAISGSAIVYTTLSLTGVLDSDKSASVKDIKQKELVVEAAKPVAEPTQNAASNNTAILNGTDVENNATVASANGPVEQYASTDKVIGKQKYNTMQSGKGQSASVAKNSSLAGNAFIGKHKNASATTIASSKTSGRTDAGIINSDKEFAGSNQGKDLKNAIAPVLSEDRSAYIATEKNASAIKSEDVIEQTPVAEMKDSVVTVAANIDSAVVAGTEYGHKYPEKSAANKPKSKVLVGFSFGVNANYTSASVGDNNKVSNIAGLLAGGVNVGIPLNNKMALQAGVQYASHTVQNVSHASAIVKYAILQDSSVTKTNITQCRYIEFPVLVKYALLPRVSVHTGIRAALLMGAQANFEQQQYSNKQLISSTPITEGEKLARFNGLRSTDFALPLGIEVALSRKFSLSATGYYGLTDFTRNDVFVNNRFDRHTSLQVMLNIKPF